MYKVRYSLMVSARHCWQVAGCLLSVLRAIKFDLLQYSIP